MTAPKEAQRTRLIGSGQRFQISSVAFMVAFAFTAVLGSRLLHSRTISFAGLGPIVLLAPLSVLVGAFMLIQVRVHESGVHFRLLGITCRRIRLSRPIVQMNVVTVPLFQGIPQVEFESADGERRHLLPEWPVRLLGRTDALIAECHRVGTEMQFAVRE